MVMRSTRWVSFSRNAFSTPFCTNTRVPFEQTSPAE